MFQTLCQLYQILQHTWKDNTQVKKQVILAIYANDLGLSLT